jgi:hypothetical protein
MVSLRASAQPLVDGSAITFSQGQLHGLMKPVGPTESQRIWRAQLAEAAQFLALAPDSETMWKWHLEYLLIQKLAQQVACEARGLGAVQDDDVLYAMVFAAGWRFAVTEDREYLLATTSRAGHYVAREKAMNRAD